ncbi:hypothetical protein MAC_01499 [Metarhizium acridum CQMa 102]|uniref:Uncharacterized protein n=2 Tax=Metarhizium acridum TaxID=92637 RepID=E9DUW6_METAQ|nr:uncharacterized protein MAC_01499 [Metarhizium acridum CQMa 102]EFY92533.1 hypothetical protein MAC_01499 [Metarhizium acridum CQMa 102]
MLQENEQLFEAKFTSPCSMPCYKTCRDRMINYAEEFKKFEELCLKTLHRIEKHRDGRLDDDSPPRWSYITLSNGSEVPVMVQTAYRSLYPIAAETSTVAGTPFDSRLNPSPTFIDPVASENANPLLEDMPGHELSATKKDVAAFSLDPPAPDDLVCPIDLSNPEFYIHPLFKDEKLVSGEMQRPGIILVKEHSSRHF